MSAWRMVLTYSGWWTDWEDNGAAMFSLNTSETVKAHMLSVLGIVQIAHNDKYIGLPVYIGRSKRKAFEYIKKKV